MSTPDERADVTVTVEGPHEPGACSRTGEIRTVCLCPLCDPEDKRLDAALAQRPRTDGAEKVARLG